MKQFINISTLFFFVFLQSCVSSHKYAEVEARKIFAEGQANTLRLDTMSKGKELRFLRKASVGYVDKIGLLVIDTSTMARQLRECWKENKSLRASQSGNLQAIAQKEAELAEKERKLDNAANFTASNDLSSEEMYQIFSQIKSKIGSFAINGVEFSLKNQVIWITVPESVMFDQYGMNVAGKGVAIMLKLSEILKEQSNLVTTLYVYSPDIEIENPTFNENWNTCALRSSAMAQVLIRYGTSPYQITSASMINRDIQKGKVEISIIGK